MSQLVCMSPSALSTTRTWCFQHRVGQRNSAKSIGPGLFQPTNLGKSDEEIKAFNLIAVFATLWSSWQLYNCSCSFIFGFRKGYSSLPFLRFTGPVASDDGFCRGTVGVDHFFELPAVLMPHELSHKTVTWVRSSIGSIGQQTRNITQNTQNVWWSWIGISICILTSNAAPQYMPSIDTGHILGKLW